MKTIRKYPEPYRIPPANLVVLIERLKSIKSFYVRTGDQRNLMQISNLLNKIINKRNMIDSFMVNMGMFSMNRFPEYGEMIDQIELICKEAEMVDTPIGMILESRRVALRDRILSCNQSGILPNEDQICRDLRAEIAKLESNL